MHWQEWRPHYEAVCADFGYDPEADRRAAWRLRRLLPDGDGFADLDARVRGWAHAAVVGCARSLDSVEARDMPGDAPVVACDGACTHLAKIGVVPSVVVTDLDGDAEALLWAAREGAVLVVHAHGDNVPRMDCIVPRLGQRVCGTYQCPPEEGLGPMRNLGGFTDGDRAVLLLEELGVERATLLGFDFGAPPSPCTGRHDPLVKPRKLAWARRIVEEAQRRGRIQVRLEGA